MYLNNKDPVISISNRAIGVSEPPYLIAEMSANHNGIIEDAFKIIEQAKNSGANAIKLQTYKPDTITLDSDREEFKISGGLWDGRSLYELYKEAHTPWEWHKPLFDYARKLNITIFSSPFDNSAVDLLEDLNTPAYKIASLEVVDLPLIKYVASTGKPLIISTGLADVQEIQEAIDAACEAGCKQLAILHCVTGYPAPAVDYNLRTIPDMINRFGLVTGLSDHTLDNATAIASIALGASIIEKHFTLDRNRGGPDDSFSLEPIEMAALSENIKTAWQAMGKINYSLKSSETGNIKFRRSLYFIKEMTKGETITDACIKSVRPGYGLPPKFLDLLIGRKVSRHISKNMPTSWDVLMEE
jgi:pseudaminic acid synthase